MSAALIHWQLALLGSWVTSTWRMERLVPTSPAGSCTPG